MGAIKDLTDLVGKPVENVQDRKFAGELRQIQGVISTIMSEQAELHEKQIALREENLRLKDQVPALMERIKELERRNIELLDPPHTEPPGEDDVKILCQLRNPHGKFADSGISERLGMALSILDYKADLLRRAGYLYVQKEDRYSYYSLTPKGRKFLFEKNLLAEN